MKEKIANVAIFSGFFELLLFIWAFLLLFDYVSISNCKYNKLWGYMKHFQKKIMFWSSQMLPEPLLSTVFCSFALQTNFLASSLAVDDNGMNLVNVIKTSGRRLETITTSACLKQPSGFEASLSQNFLRSTFPFFSLWHFFGKNYQNSRLGEMFTALTKSLQVHCKLKFSVCIYNFHRDFKLVQINQVLYHFLNRAKFSTIKTKFYDFYPISRYLT